MDFNYLYHRHQVSLFMADNAASDKVRSIHREFANRYAAKIASAKRPLRLVAAAA